MKTLLYSDRPYFLITCSGVILSIFASLLIAFYGLHFGILVILICLSLAVAYVAITNITIGIYLTFILSFFLSFINRVFQLYQYPIGSIFDILIVLMFFGLLLKYKSRNISAFDELRKDSVRLLLIIWVIVNCFQILNPAAPSTQGWFMAVKSNLYPVMYFFIFYYAITSFKQVKTLIKIWFVIILFAALYSFKQRYIGLAWYENFVYTNELMNSLFVTWGRLRVFAFLNDPMSYGLVVLNTFLLGFSLLFTSLTPYKKIILILFLAIILWSLLLTNARTAYFLLPVGLLFFGLITLNWKVIVVLLFGLTMGVGVILTSWNPEIHVFKTAFMGSDDPSMNVRFQNQKFIRPYIYKKPLGWGLASTGGFGRIYNAGSMLGSFPPDSEYVRIAIENGWICLLLWLFIQMRVFWKGFRDFIKAPNADSKIYLAAFLTLFYAYIIAQYPQEALRVPPNGIIFAFVLCMLVKLRDLSPTRVS